MALEFDYERERLQAGTSCSARDLLEWITRLHTALADCGALPGELDTEIHQQLMILAGESTKTESTT